MAADVLAILGGAAASITLAEKAKKLYATRRARRKLTWGVPLKPSADLEKSLGDKVEQLWSLYEKLGYVPVDVVQSRGANQPTRVPGADRRDELTDLRQQVNGSLVPTQPVPVAERFARILRRKPGKILNDVRRIESPDEPLADCPDDRTQVLFWRSGKAHVGSKSKSKLSELLQVDYLERPTPILIYPPDTPDKKLVQIRARRLSFIGARRCKVQLTRRALKILESPRSRSAVIPREHIYWLRLDERQACLEVGTLFQDHKILAPIPDLQQIRDLLLGM